MRQGVGVNVIGSAKPKVTHTFLLDKSWDTSYAVVEVCMLGTCKCCKEELVKVYLKLSKSGNKLYVDDKGRLWKADVCPGCQAANRKESRLKAQGKTN